MTENKGDLISREALIKKLEELANNEWNIQVGSSKGLEDAIDVAENAPTVERPQGEWIRTALYGETCYECNKCNRHQTHITKFCPNCGADMRPKPNQLRDCENCVHHIEGKGCESWECEFKKRSDV